MKPGSLTQLKSGGPVMTVRHTNQDDIKCEWFNNGVVMSHEFNSESLEIFKGEISNEKKPMIMRPSDKEKI